MPFIKIYKKNYVRFYSMSWNPTGNSASPMHQQLNITNPVIAELYIGTTDRQICCTRHIVCVSAIVGPQTIESLVTAIQLHSISPYDSDEDLHLTKQYLAAQIGLLGKSRVDLSRNSRNDIEHFPLLLHGDHVATWMLMSPVDLLCSTCHDHTLQAHVWHSMNTQDIVQYCIDSI